MALMGGREERYITLKEASRISGYSSDYLGQLIRGGKLRGKRVYANPVWMTTEEELKKYLQDSRQKRGARSQWSEKWRSRIRAWQTRLSSEAEFIRLYRGLLYSVIGLSVLLSLFVFYVFSVSLENRLNQTNDPSPLESERNEVDESRQDRSITF